MESNDDRWTGELESAENDAAAHEGGPLRHVTLAVTFLTGLPLPVPGAVAAADLWRSMGWYPLVGLALGTAALAVYSLALQMLPNLVAAAIVVLLLEVATRGLHMDGLMDTADGLFSGAPRERALEIMKDSTVGAMGVLAAVLVVALKIVALGSLAAPAAVVPLLVGWAVSRAMPPLGVYIWPYARRSGTGEAFTRERSPGPLMLAGGFVLLSLAVAGVGASLLREPYVWWEGVLLALVVVGVVAGVEALVAKRLGGLTGDVYGMSIQLGETVALVAGCALVR